MSKIILFASILALLLFSSCFKDSPAVDFSQTGNIVELLPPYGGLENFDNAALSFDAGEALDSAWLVINLAAKKTLAQPLSVTLGIDDQARIAYNSANGSDYEKLPDSVFSFPSVTGAIPEGKHLDTLTTYFYPDKLDTTRDYMLAITITDASGQPISGNFNTAYLHFDAR